MTKIIAAILMLLFEATTFAQDFTAIINLPIGSTVDVNARLILKRYDELFGTQSVVINRPGAFGQLGLDHFLSQDPQKTLLFSSHGGIVDAPEEKFGQLVPIAEISRQPFALVIRKDFPANTYKEFVEYARKNPKKINMGIQNPATSYPIVTPIEEKGNYKTTHILYAGSSNSKPEFDVARGIIDAYWTPVSSIITTGILDRVKILAITGKVHISYGGSNSITYGDDQLVGYHYTLNHAWVSNKMSKHKQEELNTKFNAIIKSEWGHENFFRSGNSSHTDSIEENTMAWKSRRDSLTTFKKKYPNLL